MSYDRLVDDFCIQVDASKVDASRCLSNSDVPQRLKVLRKFWVIYTDL